MKSYLPKGLKSNYDKYPVVQVAGHQDDCICGWDRIVRELKGKLPENSVLAVECYQGVFEDEVAEALVKGLGDVDLYRTGDFMKSEKELYAILGEDITDDRIFGFITRRTMDVYFDEDKVAAAREKIRESAHARPQVVLGVGASYVCLEWGLLAYLDMARWEIQQRFRKNLVSNVGFANRNENAGLKYKQGFFVDWRICDRWKKKIIRKVDYFIDTNAAGSPKMIPAGAFFAGLEQTVNRPFRVVPYFDRGVWGGQWMKEVCDLDRDAVNFAWCFDCVPEENSLYLGFGDVKFEIPSVDVVFFHPAELLGDNVYGRFGDEFPIRFDFLDTMDGGNLSLQVHPLIEYIQEKFGMHYTQEESYYILDAEDDAKVYLGLKEGVCPEEMISALEDSRETGTFDAEKYVGVYPVKKHDHVLIPPGTIHCSGRNSMVLEISATPYIFTFKLWDWGRVDFDGRPRPINIGHGKNVIQWYRTEPWVRKNLLHRTEAVAEGEGWKEEKTGLHEREFIETRRHWFTGKVHHNTDGSVNVLNLVEGREAVVESPSGAFEPFVVHYAETFIIPSAVGEYTIRPCGESEGHLCGTVKAYIRK